MEAYQLRFPNVAKMLLSVPWGHHKVIIDKFKGRQNDALFYVRKIVENGWSRSMLEHWIGTNLHLREGRAVTNFDVLADIEGGSDLANELLKDPYDFSFLTMTVKYRCKEKDCVTAKYSLEGVSTPIGIADYALEKFLPADFASDLPDIEEIESDQTRRLQLLLEKQQTTK